MDGADSWNDFGMCRSIVTLRGPTEATDDDVRAAALQFVRKVSGYRQPSQANREAFEGAVDEIADSVRRLLTGITSGSRRSA
jgi:hypothetical protein